MNKNLHRNNNRQKIDKSGSPISVMRINTETAYSDIYTLLQSYINNDDALSWEKIKVKIDFLYSNITTLLNNLDKETDFKKQVISQVEEGKKLLFKPNGVSVNVIDEITHGAGSGAPICSQWAFVAALMRYFHDNLDISYYQMTFGEASTTDQIFANRYTLVAKKLISREAALEGKNGDFYGGWGFYFVRKYLSDVHPSDHTDNPMNGYEDSINSNYIPPGKVNNALMVYNLNDISDPDRGRNVKVPNGGNFNEIIIHKAVIGGNESEKDAYPGCVLINTPILKMHAQDLITNCIKNLGIGLYPTDCMDEKTSTLKYSHYPNFKSKVPHSPWVMELDEKTLLPIKDENGEYIRKKTLGFSGTQCDIVSSIQNEGILIINVSDAINILNISHDPDGASVPTPEGFILSSLDPLALDFCCARYCFNNISMIKGNDLKEKNGWPTEFVQYVPLPYIKDNNILTTTGYDSPIFRYNLYDYAQKRNIGNKNYYVTGFDTLTSTPLKSVNGHLGRIDNKKFIELITSTMYYNPTTLLHHLQLTVLSYAKHCDKLTGTNIYNELMYLHDENNDGIIDYDEKGRGCDNAKFAILSRLLYELGFSEIEDTKRKALQSRYFLKYSNSDFNAENIDFLRESVLVNIINQAYELSKLEFLQNDLFNSNMHFGKGQWPSFKTAEYIYTTGAIYGSHLFNGISLNSLYGNAFKYADIKFNNSYYTQASKEDSSSNNAIKNYFTDLNNNGKLLPFTMYAPKEWSTLEGHQIPNVVETSDKSKHFTLCFEEIW